MTNSLWKKKKIQCPFLHILFPCLHKHCHLTVMTVSQGFRLAEKYPLLLQGQFSTSLAPTAGCRGLVRSSFSHTKAAGAGSHGYMITSCRNQAYKHCSSALLGEINAFYFILFQVILLRSERLRKVCKASFVCGYVGFTASQKNKLQMKQETTDHQ